MPRKSPVSERKIADRAGWFERTGEVEEETPPPPRPPRAKRTYHLPEDVVLTLNQVQLERYRQTGKKPELSDLVAEGIRLLAQSDQQTTQ